MGYVMRMPQLGMSMESGTVVEWRVGEGDRVKEGAVVAVVESEKTSAEVESRTDGALRRVLIPEGETVEPGDPIGIIAGPDEDLAPYLDEAGATADDDPTGASPASSRPSSTPDTPAPSAADPDVRATPGARRRADAEGVNLGAVDGTGPQGVVTEADVERAAESVAASAESESGTGGAPTRTVAETVERSRIQRTVADRLGESYRDAVHVTVRRTVDAAPARDVVEAAAAAGADVSLADLAVKSLGDALTAHPRFNAVFEDDRYDVVEEVNVGYAVDVPDGLRTPVVPEVDAESVEAVAERRRELVARAEAGDLSPDDESGGTVTVTNLGPLGVDSFDPIVNPPEVAILGVGRVRDGEWTLSLAFDHRVRNGADAARLLDTLAATLTDRATLRGFFDASLDGGPTTRRSVTARVDDGYAGTYRSADGEVAFDEPPAVGGGGNAPEPVDHLLGALGACLTVSVCEIAERDGVSVTGVETRVDGAPETGPLSDIDVTVTLTSPDDDDTVDRVVRRADRACHVARALGGVDRTVTWERRA